MKDNFINNKLLGLFVKTNGFFSKPLFAGRGHILCFHRLVKDGGGALRIIHNSGKEISVDKLRFILIFFLSKGYDFINMDQLFERISNNKSPKKFIALTFDDGYIDNYTIAYPLLKELGIPFTVYVSTGMPDHRIIQWPYFLEEYLLRSVCAEFQYNGIEYMRNLLDPHDMELAYCEIRNIILKDENNIVPFLINQVFKLDDDQIIQFVKENSLTWEHLEEMSRDESVTIGAHGMDHLALSALDESIAFDEIMGSKKRLEEKLQVRINHFAYPYGTFNEFTLRDIDLVKRAGFETAVTLNQGNVFTSHKNYLHALPRIPLGNFVNEEILHQIFYGIRQFSFNGFKRIIK